MCFVLSVICLMLCAMLYKVLRFLFYHRHSRRTSFFTRPTVYPTAISPHLGDEGWNGGCSWGSEGSGVSIWPCTRGAFLPEINGETWYQQVMCNKHSWLMSLKEESPKGHFKLIRKPSCGMMNAHFWVKIHTLNPLAHGRPPCLPNCLRI